MKNDTDNTSASEFVIVIGREYGSGGRRIGKRLADELGVRYYDKSLLSEAASKLGYSPEIFEHKDERRPSLIRSLLSFTYGAQTAEINNQTLSDEKIYEFQSRVIRDICRHEPCVIVGRTADYIMRDHPGLISLFVHAPIERRIDAILARGETDDREKARETADHIDRNRESYYNYYTNSNGWGRARNYHLTFDSSVIGDNEIAQFVRSIIESRHAGAKKKI